MSEIDSSKCRRCAAPIYWHKSKAGKPYPCDSEDRRDFHRCPETPAPKAAPQPLDATTDERLDALESAVARLVRQLNQLGAQLPITNADIPF